MSAPSKLKRILKWATRKVRRGEDEAKVSNTTKVRPKRRNKSELYTFFLLLDDQKKTFASLTTATTAVTTKIVVAAAVSTAQADVTAGVSGLDDERGECGLKKRRSRAGEERRLTTFLMAAKPFRPTASSQ